jgi:hypothetical protein
MSEIRFYGQYEIEIHQDDELVPKDLFARAQEPDFPYLNTDRSPLSRYQVLSHLAHNILRNGVTDISELDGWADYPRGAVTFSVPNVDLEEELPT